MKNLIKIFALCCMTVGTLIFAAEVGKIEVQMSDGTPATEVVSTFVTYSIETAVGKEFNPATLSKDVSSLYKTGSFEDVKTKISANKDGKVEVTFILAAKKQVSNIVITGNNLFPEKKLMKKIKHGTNVLLNYDSVAEDCKTLREYYSGKGYYGTEVTTQVMVNPDGKTLTLEYIIKETTRCKLQGVDFEGNMSVSSKELSDAIYTKRQWWRYILRFGNYYNDGLQIMDMQKIEEVYRTHGYWDCKVTGVDLRYDEERKWVTVVYIIDEGGQYTVGNVSVVGSQKFTGEYLLEKTAMRRGDVFTSTSLDADIAAMSREYERLGYIDLRVIDNVDRNQETHVADIVYNFSEGLPCRIQEIMIVGNTRTQDRVIRRELTIHPDDLADAGKITQSKNRVMNLGYFNEVTFEPEPTESPSLRNLRMQVDEKATGTLSLGAGYSTEDSVVGYMELSERNFDVSKLMNLERPVGAGQRFRSYIGLGSKTKNISISLTEPALFDSDFELTTDLFHTTRYEDEYDESHTGAGVNLSWPVAFLMPFTDDHIEYWKMNAGLRLEQIKISDVDSDEKNYYYDMKNGVPRSYKYSKGKRKSIYEDRGSETVNRLCFGVTRDTRNAFIFPTHGSKIDLDVEYVTKALGSYADYFKFHSGAVKYMPVCYDLIMKMSIDGFAAKHVSGDDIKIFDRYFAGGYGTIRGFKRHEVSPQNQLENSIGGETMIVGTVEIIKPLYNFMFVRAFMDAGNVWDGSFKVDSDYCASVGVGVQFKAIPIRLDYGIPIKKTDHLDSNSGRLHFNVDYSF